jgi:hypothetical protein
VGIRERVRGWAEPPPLPALENGEQLLLEGSGRRLPIGVASKSDYASFGRIALTNTRLIYLVPAKSRAELGDTEIAWSAVTAAALHRGPGKFMRAPGPYFAWLFMRHPMFTLTVDGQEQRFQVIGEKDWRSTIDQLRILYPVLDPLARR